MLFKSPYSPTRASNRTIIALTLREPPETNSRAKPMTRVHAREERGQRPTESCQLERRVAVGRRSRAEAVYVNGLRRGPRRRANARFQNDALTLNRRPVVEEAKVTFEGREGLFTTVERGQRLGGFLQSRPSNERTNGQFSSRLTPLYQSQHIHTEWQTCSTHSLSERTDSNFSAAVSCGRRECARISRSDTAMTRIRPNAPRGHWKQQEREGEAKCRSTPSEQTTVW